MIKTELIDYKDGDVQLEGYCAYDDAKSKKPVVLIAHDWSGKNKFACHKADQIAELGYVGFAIDMYGKGLLGQTKEEKTALISPLMNNRKKLQTRMLAGFKTAQSLPNADTKKIAAIGFCFGGLCALDLARCSDEVIGVISFHGLLTAPDNKSNHITAKILALHGFNDPMVKPESVMDFCNEMTAAKADWQMHMYGNTMHGFTNPEANDPSFGTVYNKLTEQRALRAMEDFFEEIFA